MAVLIVLLTYVLISWIVAFCIGMHEHYDSLLDLDEFEIVAVLVWPLGLFMVILMCVFNFFFWAWERIPAKEKAELALHRMSLVFRPVALAAAIRQWRERKQSETKQA